MRKPPFYLEPYMIREKAHEYIPSPAADGDPQTRITPVALPDDHFALFGLPLGHTPDNVYRIPSHSHDVDTIAKMDWVAQAYFVCL